CTPSASMRTQNVVLLSVGRPSRKGSRRRRTQRAQRTGSISHVKDSLQRINRRKERVSVGIDPGLVGNDRSRLTFHEVPGLKRCAFYDKLVWHVVWRPTVS